jgi:phage recombination protein Bet
VGEQAVAVRSSGTNLVTSLSERWGVSPENLVTVVKTTIFRGDAARASNAELVAFLQVCERYDLNPFIREIYAFVGKGGGVFPIVGVDGWVHLVNRNPQFDGVEFLDQCDDQGHMIAITCAMTVKGRQLPVKITEYMAECVRDTEPWKKWPRRMLRHKAYIQCARYAFGYAGIYDEDEAERIQEAIRATRGPIIEMPLSVAEAEARKSDGDGKGMESLPTGSAAGAPEAEPGVEGAGEAPAADRLQASPGEPSADEQAAIRAREQAEATAPQPPQPEPPQRATKVDRGLVWNEVMRKAKAEKKTASTVLMELTAKHNMTDLSDAEVLGLAKKLGVVK